MDSQPNEPTGHAETTNDAKSSGHAEEGRPQHLSGDGASPGKIFVGGLSKETTSAQFVKHFGKYGEITDSVIMTDRQTRQPRGFGFVTYADASVVDEVIKNDHIINGKQVEIKRTIPKGAVGSKDFKTKKIFVGGIPATVTDDELSNFFMQFGEVKEHMIMRDHATSRSRGFGFVTFESEQTVDDLLAKGNRLDFADAQVEIKKAEPRKSNPPSAPSKRYNDSRPSFGGGYGDAYGGYGGGGGMGAGYRSGGSYGGRGAAYGGHTESEFSRYGAYGAGGMGTYRGDPSLDYSSRYGGAFSRGYDMGGGYGGPGEGYGGYGGAGAGAGGYGYGAGLGGGGYGGGAGGGYGGSGAGGGSFYGSSRGGYGGAAGTGRYHPYGR